MPNTPATGTYVLYHVSSEGTFILALDADAEALRNHAADLEAEINDDLRIEPAVLEWEMEDRLSPMGGRRVDVEVCQPPWFSRDNYYAIQLVLGE